MQLAACKNTELFFYTYSIAQHIAKLLSLNSEMGLGLLRKPLGLQGKEVVLFEMEWDFEPRVSEEDALSIPPRPIWRTFWLLCLLFYRIDCW